MPETSLIEQTAADYPSLWRKITDKWRRSKNEDAAWLTYAANYLFQTSGVHWALDPYYLPHRIGKFDEQVHAADLTCMEMVILSHEHNDHLDLELIRILKDLPVCWVIPEFLLEKVTTQSGISKEKIVVPHPGMPFTFKGITITPFDSLHINGDRGVPEMGYLTEFNNKRWLFPGDIRRFDAGELPQFGNLDGIFAHLWLGKGCALLENPLHVEEFQTFFSRLNPKKLVVTHMHEIGREKEDIWELRHYAQVLEKFRLSASQIKIQPALTGQKIIL